MWLVEHDSDGDESKQDQTPSSCSNNNCAFFQNPFLKNTITLPALNQQHILHSHLLMTSNFIEKIIAYLFNVYPHDIFSTFEKPCDDNQQVNKPLLAEKLNALPNDYYIKFFVFNKSFPDFNGHSMVIKKVGDHYSFFDPDQGEFRNLSIDGLCLHINAVMKKCQGTHMAFIDGMEYIKSLGYPDQVQNNRFRA